MLTLKHTLAGFLAFGLVLAAAPGGSARAEEYVEGEDYDVISPAIAGRHPDKIEVTEFFSYSCGHCYNFEPVISKWKESQPDDVVVVPSPVIWNKPMELLAKAYYAAEVLDVTELMHLALFQAIHVDRQRLTSAADIAEVFEDGGVPEEEFLKAFNSFGVSSLARQADARARAARISGTPEVMVAGKYRVTTRKAGSQAGMLEIAEFLIEKERAAKAAAAPAEAATGA
ncbi:thiol:disulfide interchange protein DsbA/DsbL [Pseudohaliea sp.]|uniref:thiol:disulfide interchange protein DsbA/DsbL n=1 Tax=Pseudohaliea sp. TaxID=2740289 RepID=UPI0032EE7C03